MNIVDIVVIAVIIISGLFAFVRGFVQETLSVVGWVGAPLATFYTFEYLRPFLRRYIDHGLIADILTGVAIFVVTLVVLSLVSHGFAVRVRASPVSALDRSLGFLFGLARGAVVVVAAYLLVEWAVEREERPPWLLEARLMPYAEYGGEIARSLVPESWRNKGVSAAERLGAQARETIAAPEGSAGGDGPEPPDDSQSDAGYQTGVREGVELLLRNIGSGDR